MSPPLERVHTTIATPFGDLLAIADGGALTSMHWVPPDAAAPVGSRPAPEAFDELVRQLDDYWAGRKIDFDFPLRPAGTPFQQDVWRSLARIPYGRTVSYGELARRIDRPRAIRAVGRANGANPIAILVPCHRVIGANGRLTGYAGGLERKLALLRLEGVEGLGDSFQHGAVTAHP